MSSIQERLQLKRVPLDTWNIKEQLCLASAVVRSGDQNWMSVSRALKSVGDTNRPPDWYSQKSCAAQYGALLEHVETPKRKKRSSEGAVETPQESILKRLTQERIVEIQKTVAEMNQQYDSLKTEIAEARNTSTSEERLREMWTEIEAAKRARERENARRAAWLKEREERRARAERTWRPPASTTPQAAPVAGAPAPPSSPLLTSLLKSSPVVTTPQHISHPANVVDSVSPSAGAPTLSMLLEKSTPAATSPQDNKHAAIEHIKSQLVQIEQQLKASTAAPAPASVDIDDIEIKAEDVYAFRDVDIHLPPVAHIHKPNNRPLEKPSSKKDEQEPPEEMDTSTVAETLVEQIKEEPAAVVDQTPEEMLPVDVETVAPTPEPEPPAEVVEEQPAAEEALRIGFPEVKFPSLEINIVREDQQIKEEVKEAEAVVDPEDQEDVEVNVEDIPAPEEEAQSSDPPEAPAEPPPAESQAPADPVHPEDIPLPETPVEEAPVEETTDPPVPPEPEAPQEEPEEVAEEEKREVAEVEVKQEEIPPPETTSEDTEDSLPPKEAAPVEPPPEPEVKEEPLPEAEETHTETDDDTPMELSREEEKDGKKRRDYSRKKKPDSRTCSGSESAAEASAPDAPDSPSGPSGTDAERQHRLWKKSVMLVYSRLCAHKYASIFLRPITDEEAPGYSSVIKKPMDLTTIRRNIEAGVIRTTAEFQRDVLLMLSNALMYNHTAHSVYQMARDMHEEARTQLGMLVAAQAHAGLAPLPARRKRRRREPPAQQLQLAKRLH